MMSIINNNKNDNKNNNYNYKFPVRRLGEYQSFPVMLLKVQHKMGEDTLCSLSLFLSLSLPVSPSPPSLSPTPSHAHTRHTHAQRCTCHTHTPFTLAHTHPSTDDTQSFKHTRTHKSYMRTPETAGSHKRRGEWHYRTSVSWGGRPSRQHMGNQVRMKTL
jgi:hypothetical protein